MAASQRRLCWVLAIVCIASLALVPAARAQEDDFIYEDDAYFYGEMDDGLEDFADFNDFGATPAEGGAGAAATPAAGTPATTPSTATPAAGAPATGTPAPKTSKSNRQKKAPSTNKIVGFAPEANVTYGDDIDDEGKCAKEIERYCKDVEEGEGQLADCISDAITLSELGPELGSDDDLPEISDECREEVYQYKILRNTNINRNVPLARVCKVDADKYCNVTWFFGYKSGQVLSCLKDVKNSLSKACKSQVFKIMQDAAWDLRADPQLWASCKDDSDNLCKGIKPGGGRLQSCLRDKRMQLSWACEEQLFRQEIENADDIRLSVRLLVKCMPDKRKFCKDVEPGNARTKQCLEEHREELTNACREEIDSVIERRVRDFRLDSKLRDACEAEIANMCAYFGDLDDIDTYDSSVINCLQDYQQEIKSQECKRQVKKYMVLASQDIRFDVPLAEACYDDRQKYCASVPPGSARVIRCLMGQREKLSPVCRATLFDEEVRFSENIDFQFPMKEACRNELTKYCKDVPHGNARAIRCLQDNKEKKDFSKACKHEIELYESEISKDYRLNFRLNKNCQKDVQNLCANVCGSSDGNVCGGKVLRCLTDKVDEIQGEDCRKEVFYYTKMEVENYKNDIILAEACREDVDKYCANVEPGDGRVHQCLRDNRKKLSEQCRKEELLLEEKESTSVELSVNLMRACKAERQLFCSEVQPGSARVFRCLAENMNDADFGNNCKYQIIYKLQRRQANWKLDPPLRKACRADVQQLCAEEDAKNSEEGLVYKCLVKNVGQISTGCQKELGRAVHMAFFVWQPGAILTSACDDDITNICLAARPNMAQRPGAVGSCLASILERQDKAGSDRRMLAEDDKEDKKEDQPKKEEKPKEQPKKEDKPKEQPKKEEKKEPQPEPEQQPVPQENAADQAVASAASASLAAAMGPVNNPKALMNAKLSPQCAILADIAEPPNMKQAFDTSLSIALLKSQLDVIDSATGIPLVTRDRRGVAQGISLTGWVAMLGMAAMVIVIAYGAFVLYKRVRGIPDKDYTLVVKSTTHK